MDEIIMGKSEMMDSAIMIARATHNSAVSHDDNRSEIPSQLTIHPRAPSVLDETGPGAHPRCLDSGDKIPQPTNIPAVIDNVTGKPMITPVLSGQKSQANKLRLPCPT